MLGLALGDHAVAGEGDVGDVGVLEEYLPEGLAAVAYLVAYEELHGLFPVEAHVIALHVLDLHGDEQRTEYQDEGDDVLEAHEDGAHLASLCREGEGALEDHGGVEGGAVPGREDAGDEGGEHGHAEAYEDDMRVVHNAEGAGDVGGQRGGGGQ